MSRKTLIFALVGGLVIWLALIALGCSILY